jgi:hypothetical protein
MDEVVDLQAQIVSLRLAVEGLWLSMLRSDPDGLAQAQRLGRENAATIGQIDASTEEAKIMRDAVMRHTEQLWGSIGWQLEQDQKSV